MTEERILDWLEVMTRSRMLLLMWVADETCCTRLNESSRVRNCKACPSDESLTWMLKSPVIKKSSGVVAADDRNEQNSERNVENGLEYDDESGGR